jgi:lipopolysaccharide export system permease protein
MGSIGRYIFRTTLGAFLLVLLSLTAVVWVTQALGEIDLVTNQGQSVLVFMGITGLGIPILVLIIAPIALVIAVGHVLNKLGGDSEIIVMNAAGMSPWIMFRAFMAVAIVVAIGVLAISSYLAPLCLRELRHRAAEARADLVANIVQPGRFTSFEKGLTFHIRERRSGGRLLGIFVDDARNPKERTTFLAEDGKILRDDRGTFLVMVNGSVQRYEQGQPDPAIVLFDRYAFDLSQFTPGTTRRSRSLRERYTWDLLFPKRHDPVFRTQRGKYLAELNQRLTAPLYPFVFVILTYAYLGAPRTNRQSRAMAVTAVICIITALRLFGFMSTVFSTQTPAFAVLQYIALAVAAGLGLRSISLGAIIEMPAFIANTVSALSERLARPAAAA